jgi:hypothetical protein
MQVCPASQNVSNPPIIPIEWALLHRKAPFSPDPELRSGDWWAPTGPSDDHTTTSSLSLIFTSKVSSQPLVILHQSPPFLMLKLNFDIRDPELLRSTYRLITFPLLELHNLPHDLCQEATIHTPQAFSITSTVSLLFFVISCAHISQLQRILIPEHTCRASSKLCLLLMTHLQRSR